MTGDLTGRTVAQYSVTARLGEGGMRQVYRATDTKLKRDVAIKVLPTAIRFGPFLAALRDDPRFLGLLGRMRRESNVEPPLSQE